MSHIVVKKGGIFWKGGVDSGSVVVCSGKEGELLGGGGRLWEGWL